MLRDTASTSFKELCLEALSHQSWPQLESQLSGPVGLSLLHWAASLVLFWPRQILAGIRASIASSLVMPMK